MLHDFLVIIIVINLQKLGIWASLKVIHVSKVWKPIAQLSMFSLPHPWQYFLMIFCSKLLMNWVDMIPGLLRYLTLQYTTKICFRYCCNPLINNTWYLSIDTRCKGLFFSKTEPSTWMKLWSRICVWWFDIARLLLWGWELAFAMSLVDNIPIGVWCQLNTRLMRTGL